MKTGILPPELKSVSDLLNGDVRYAVPKYQRSFAWSADEIEEFWDDLCGAVARKGQYFLGTMVLQKKNAGPTEIIDGQQRLTCVSIVFSAIRNVFLAAKIRNERACFSLPFLAPKDFSAALTRPQSYS